MGGEPETIEGLTFRLGRMQDLMAEVLSKIDLNKFPLSIPSRALAGRILAATRQVPYSESPASPDTIPPRSRSPSPPAASSLSGKRTHATDSESDDPESVDMSGNEDEGYTIVMSKKNKRSRKPSVISEPDVSERRVPPAPRARTRPTVAKFSRPPSSFVDDVSKDVPSEGRRVKPPPPLYLRNKADWAAFTLLCKDSQIAITGSNTTQGIRIMTKNCDSFRAAVKILTEQRMPYHTHTLLEDRKLRVVIRGVPKEFPEQEVREDLFSQNFPVHTVHRMYSRDRKPLDLVAVSLDFSPEGKSIYKEKFTILGMSGLTVETPHSRGGPMQCHRCQLYGHIQANCHAEFACVKCLGSHKTRDCTRNKETDGPPSCVLCKQSGHPANYRGCPRAPKTKRPIIPNRTPAFKPAPAPAVPAWQRSDFPPLPKTTPTAYIPPPQRTPPPVALSSQASADAEFIRSCIRKLSYEEELALLAGKLRNALTDEQRVSVLREHTNIVNRLR